MMIQVLLIGGTLCLIYFTNYMDTYNANQQLLERYVQSYSARGNFERNFRGRWNDNDAESRRQNNIFGLSTFYSVSFSKNDEVINVYNVNNIYTEEELIGVEAYMEGFFFVHILQYNVFIKSQKRWKL